MAELSAPPSPRAVASTGVPGLDDILSGGLTRRRLYLVEGVPGSGKTTLALQYLMEGARGESESPRSLNAATQSRRRSVSLAVGGRTLTSGPFQDRHVAGLPDGSGPPFC